MDYMKKIMGGVSAAIAGYIIGIYMQVMAYAFQEMINSIQQVIHIPEILSKIAIYGFPLILILSVLDTLAELKEGGLIYTVSFAFTAAYIGDIQSFMIGFVVFVLLLIKYAKDIEDDDWFIW